MPEAPNLGVMLQSAEGDAPGNVDNLSGQSPVAIATVGSIQDHAPAVVFPPSDLEFRLAIQAGTAAMKVSVESRDTVTQALLMQQDVLLRHILCQRSGPSSSGSMSFVSSSSSSLSSTSGSSFSSGDGQPGVSAGVAMAGVIVKISPPKNFKCPMCPAILNERDFGRHIDTWLDRDGSKRLRSNQCPGVGEGHKYLRSFHGSHSEKVGCFHAAVRRLIHPGCDAARSAQGSGNHIAVEAFLRQLSSS